MNEIEYHLTLTLKFRTDPEIHVKDSPQREEHLRQIIDYFISHPEIMHDYRKSYLVEVFRWQFFMDNVTCQIDVKNENEILFPIISELPQNASSYFFNVFFDGFNEEKNGEELEQDRALISQRLHDYDITGFDFKELEKVRGGTCLPQESSVPAENKE